MHVLLAMVLLALALAKAVDWIGLGAPPHAIQVAVALGELALGVALLRTSTRPPALLIGAGALVGGMLGTASAFAEQAGTTSCRCLGPVNVPTGWMILGQGVLLGLFGLAIRASAATSHSAASASSVSRTSGRET